MNQKHSQKKVLLKNKVIPAFMAAVATSALTYVLYYFNFDVLYGVGVTAILFASFGASAFILFVTPRSKAAKIGRFIRSYVMAAVIGVLGFYMLGFFQIYVVAGIEVFVLSLVMYAADAAHPPAVGIALAFVLYRVGIIGVVIVIFGVAVLLSIRVILERFIYIIENNVIR